MNFESIQDYYDYQESDTSFLFNHQIFNSLLKLKEKTEEKALKSVCSYEMYFSDYVINGGRLKPKIHYENGESYPNHELFDDNFEYVKTRAKDVVNHKYKAKYNNLLWESKHKRIDYAKSAVDSYFSILQNAEVPAEDNLSHFVFVNYFKNLFTISQTINYKKEESIQLALNLLGTSKLQRFKEYALIKFIIEDGKKIETSTFQYFYDYANRIINDSTYPELLSEYLKLLISLCIKLNISPKEYHNKLAEFHIAEAERQKDSFIVHDFYLKALSQYQKADNKEQMEKVSILIENAKSTLDFKSVGTEYTDELVNKWYEAVGKATDELAENGDSKDHYEYLILGQIFPSAELLDQEIRPVTFDFVSVMTFDINRNVSKKKKSGINPYFLHLQNFSLPHLAMVFSKGIKNQKMSFDSIVDYLNTSTWYGQNFTTTNPEGEALGFKWVELLSPSLFNFFNQSEIDLKANKNSYQGYILCIDSLTIKFEGLLREFSRHIGAQTIEYKDDGTEARISFEKLLENDKLKAIVPQNDLALFTFLFKSKGMNLRNNVAHCFYQTGNYSPGVMFLLISALLRLGNYKLTLTSEQPPS